MQSRWMPCSAESMTLPGCGHSGEIPDLPTDSATTHDPGRRLREGVGATRTLAAMPACNEEAAIAKTFPGVPVRLQLKTEIPKHRIAGQRVLNRFTNFPTDDEFAPIDSRSDFRALARGVGVDSELAPADNEGARTVGREYTITLVPRTRLETIELSPIDRECEAQNPGYFTFHSGQHYFYDADRALFENAGLSGPKYHLNIGSGIHARKTSDSHNFQEERD